jgi:hypothetical protein
VDELGELTELGTGGQGTVYATARRLGDGPAAYKEFAPPARAALNVPALQAMIRLRAELPAPVAGRLDEATAWPVAVVQRDGRVTGFLMRQAPAAFHTEITVPRGRVRLLAQVQLLLNGERYLSARGLDVDDRFRRELLHDVAQTIELLHGLGVVVGDLSPNNLLFSSGPRPRCFFLDCDAMRLGGDSVLEQAETADWEAPAGDRQIATPATDSYKFALLCARLFAGDQTVRLAPPAQRAGPALRRLVVQGLSADPAQRPEMAQWRRALAGTRPRGRAVTEPARDWLRPAGVVLAVLLLIALIVPLRGCSGWVAGIGGTSGGARPGTAEQANGVARLLADSGRSRQHLDTAVAACAEAALRAVAGERGAQLERLEALHVDLLPSGAGLRTELGVALGHARRAADAYAAWAAGGCGSRRRGDAEARRAGDAWQRVATLWNPVADAYGHSRVNAQDL